MARQIIDTTTNNGSYIGDPAKTAFEKVNAMTLELYGESIQGNRTISGTLTVAGSASMSSGSVRTMPGTSTNAGYVSFHRLDGVRLGYIGWNAGNKIQYSVENGYTGHSFIGTVESTGVMTAHSFNPTSTADVKDFIEGYADDACEAIDKLVVISYKYRPEYLESEKTFIGLLEENVKSVVPDAANDSATIVEEVDGEEVERFVPGNIDIMQILALSIRSHQQKNARIKALEDRLSAAGI